MAIDERLYYEAGLQAGNKLGGLGTAIGKLPEQQIQREQIYAPLQAAQQLQTNKFQQDAQLASGAATAASDLQRQKDDAALRRTQEDQRGRDRRAKEQNKTTLKAAQVKAENAVDIQSMKSMNAAYVQNLKGGNAVKLQGMKGKNALAVADANNTGKIATAGIAAGASRYATDQRTQMADKKNATDLAIAKAKADAEWDREMAKLDASQKEHYDTLKAGAELRLKNLYGKSLASEALNVGKKLAKTRKDLKTDTDKRAAGFAEMLMKMHIVMQEEEQGNALPQNAGVSGIQGGASQPQAQQGGQTPPQYDPNTQKLQFNKNTGQYRVVPK